MEVEIKEQSQEGMSRAAKKRAKKKQKQKVTKANAEDNAAELPAKRPRVQPPKEPLSQNKSEEKAGNDKAPATTTNIPTVSCNRLCDIVTSDDFSTSRERARGVLQFLLHDTSVANFYSDYFEKQPLFVQSESKGFRKRFQGGSILSKQSIRDALNEHPAYYGRDLNVTRYEKGKDGVKRRVTLDLMKDPADIVVEDDELDPTDVSNYVPVDTKSLWKQYKDGCTIRLLCPHKHADDLQSILSLLELEWGCMVGANAYLTPPCHSQGFAPHYDDIEAFCLQLEGRKRWKVYPPRSKGEHLPRASSEDFTEEDLKDLEPILDVVMEPGDMLYMPRGWIHQACTLPSGTEKDGHSLHLTISSMQQWAWADLMEILLPAALEAATKSDTSTYLRAGLPPRFLDYMGAMHDNRDEDVPEVLKKLASSVEDEHDKANANHVKELQEGFRVETKKRIMRVAKEAMNMLDAVCDQMAKRYLSDRQPPGWTPHEKEVTGDEDEEMLPNRLLRLRRPGVARLVLEDDKAIVYHCCDNSRVYHEKPLSPLEFELDDAPAIEQLLNTNEPHWICVSDLIHDSIEDKVGVAQALYDEGILALRPRDD